jgi:hypothetical protein
MIGIAALVMITGGAIFFRSIEALYFAFGVILTSGLNVLKVYMLERTVARTLEMDQESKGENYVKLQNLLRFGITAVVLLGVGLVQIYAYPPFINIFGAIFGLFTLQISVLTCRKTNLEEN